VTVRFGYTILYVTDVAATVRFYEAALGLTCRFVHESGLYSEMETGTTVLAFAGEAMAEMNGFAIRANRKSDLAAGFELAFVFDDPHAAYASALAAGASPVKPPEQKPWGQTVGYVRDLNGCLIEICSAVTS
jgi:lactoylglutathione lyase